MDRGEVGVGFRFSEGEGESTKGLGFEENIKIGVNGGVGHERDGAIGSVRENEVPFGEAGFSSREAKVNGEVNDSSPKLVGSSIPPEGSEETVVSPVMKGKGLKKWRRIRREVSKDGGSEADSGRILKRGLAMPEPNRIPDENKQKNDDGEGESSVASVDIRNFGSGSLDDVNLETGSHLGGSIGSLDPDLVELLVSGGGFSVGADSDNSEERSSKSSTVASAPRHRHEGFGIFRERNRPRNFSGKGSGHLFQQKGHRGKGGLDATKKVKEDCVELGKENSHSSIESDLRSKNDGFMLNGSTSSNGLYAEELVNYDIEKIDETQICEALQGGYCKENGRETEELRKDLHGEDGTKEEVREEIEDSSPGMDQDPFTDSITLLQEAQEALEKEIQKFEEIGKNPISISGYSSDHSYFEETEGNSSLPLESKLIYLQNKVENLESELEEALTVAKLRELKVLELERVLNEAHLTTNQSNGDDPAFLEKRFREAEAELEGLFKKKLEVEIECLALRKAIRAWKIMVEDQFTSLEEQKLLSEDYEKLMGKLDDAQDEAILLKRKTKKLEASCEDLLGTDGVVILQNEVYKFSGCFMLQVVMLCIAFWLFIMQLLPPSNEVMPT